MSRRPISHLSALLLLALGATSCGDFARVNPFDPGVKVTLAISGPDSLFSIGDSALYTLNVTPAYAHEAPTWWLSDTHGSMEAAIDQRGLLTVYRDGWAGGAPGITQDVTIHARLGGGRVATRKLIFVHRPVMLCLLTCGAHEPITLDSLHSSLKGPVGFVDARGNWMKLSIPQSILARSSVVAVGQNENYIPLDGVSLFRQGIGSSWVVATAGGFTDSLFVSVTDTLVPHPQGY
jgi:hypothetical protein